MIYKKNLTLVISLITFILNASSGQSGYVPFTPKIIPPSPNAASLQKFGDIPVSPYTGTTDISIPVYTIQAKGVSVPIALDYHTGGIRLSEEAGWVGLGWALNAGGMISRTINDKDDFVGGYFNSSLIYPMPEAKGRLLPYILYPTQPYLGNWGYEFACNYKVHTELGDVNYLSAFKQAFISTGSYDFEPDSYSFNFLGRSGKFIIGRDGKMVLQKQENLKIEFATDGLSFIITDEQGNKYYFLDKEYSRAATGIGAQAISSWMLSKIITQQKDSIIFHYTNSDNTWSTVKGITHETLRNGVSDETPIYSNDPGTDYYNQTLQSIDYDNCEVQFAFDGNRTDLQNGKKLNKIKIYSKNQNGLNYIKEDDLYYSYFNNGFGDPYEFARLRLDSVKEVSGNASIPPYIFAYNLQPNNQNLMGKHYSSVDHWGYFNGVSNALYGDNTLGFTPSFTGIVTLHGIGQYLSTTGANREPDFSFMQTFSLNKVTYPTGGYTILEYEPNYYDYQNSISGREGRDYEYVALQNKVVQIQVNQNGTFNGNIDFSDIYLTSSSVSNANLTVAFRAANSDSLNYYHNSLSFGNINFTFQNNIRDITNSAAQCSGTMNGSKCSGNVYSISTPLVISSPSTYSLSGYISPKVKIGSGFMDITATFTYLTPVYKHSTMLMAGGLRIKTIKDYSANGKLAKKRIYDYTYQQDRDNNGVNETYSYGRLMGYLSYARNELISSPTFPNFATSLTRYSSSFSAFTSQSSGNIVGYDQVTEYTIDSASGLDNGKTVYTFYNSSDTSFSYAGYRFPGVLNLPNNLNGLPKSKSVFSRTGTGYKRIATTDYYYHSANRIIYDAFKWFHYNTFSGIGRNDPNNPIPCTNDTHGYPITTGCNCPTQVDTAGYQLTANFYPAISSEVVLLDSTVETTLDQNDTTIQFKNITRNYYDNPKHYQLTRTRFTDSKGNTHVTLIRYPQDYLAGNNTTVGNKVIDSMIQKNIVSVPIEKTDSFYVSGSSSGLVQGSEASVYKLLNPALVIALDKQYKLDLSSTVNNFQPLSFSGNTINKDSRYRQMISFDSYDNTYNIIQYTTVDGLPMSYIWDYFQKYPIAQVKNATGTQIAYTSFEADSKGNWIFTGAPSADNTAPTGGMVYKLGNGNITYTTLNPAVVYTVSLWAKAQPTVANLTLVKTGETISAWTYYEYQTNVSITSVTISGTTYIDELRLYPVNAQMTTYTYIPQLGISSVCDINSRISYYEYDLLGRLNIIRDQDKNVLKKLCYNYAGQPSACEGVVYYNAAANGVFTRNNCAAGKIGGTVTYNVAASTYFSIISQADADQQAQADIAANGQNYANTNGACTDPPLINVTYTNATNYTEYAQLTNTATSTTYNFTMNAGSTNVTASLKIPQGTYNAYIYSANGTALFRYQIYTFNQMGVNSIHAYNLSLCATCATISVTNYP